MKKQPVSVILTTHNGRKDACKRAIESVLAQSYQDFELIVVDDGSKDGTDKMVASFKDSRIVYIKRKKCFGNDTQPKNDGIKAAKGYYIGFLDSDNTYRLDHLAALVKHIKNYDLVYGDRFVRSEEKVGVGVSQTFSATALLSRNYIDTSDVLVKKTVLEYVGGWDERYGKYVDWNLWLRIAKAGFRFKHVPLVLTEYHQTKDAKSFTKLTKAETEYIEANGTPCPNIPDWDAHELEIRLPFLGDITEPRVAIFTLTYDRLDYTKRMIESLHKTAGYAFDHYIIDNGSRDGTKKWLEENRRKFVGLIDFPDNKGISISSNTALDEIMIGANIGMKRGQNYYNLVVKVDNDALFITHGWLKRMVEIWKVNHLLAMSPYPQGLVDSPGGAPRVAYGQILGELVGMTQHLGGLVHCVSSKAYEHFRWDEDQPLHGVQDLEFSQYLTNSGYQMCYLENYFVEHMDGTDGQKEKYPAYFNRRKLEKVSKYEH